MEDPAYRFGDFSISPGERGLFHGTKSVALPPKVFDALYLLVRNPGSLVSRSEIIHALWPGVHVTEANLTNIVVLLRKVLGRESIQTVSKFGYRFTLPVIGEPGVKQATYASFVRGKELLAERTLDSVHRARDLFWFCLAQDPNFAIAWAWLGRSYHLVEKLAGRQPESPHLAEAAFQRAFVIDPGLACAHHFYTQVQVDAGHAAQAMTRLATRLKEHPEEPETLAGLVQVLRCCGLLRESVAAHERAITLDPTIRTSVAHTLFLEGAYADVFENYTAKLGYLDVAAWAALGDVERAARLLRMRLGQPELGTLMRSMMASLLAVLEEKREEALAIIEQAGGIREPEGFFYLARHCGMLNAAVPAVELLRQARLMGFWSPRTLEQDHAFDGIRMLPEFERELREAQRLAMHSSHEFHSTLGYTLLQSNGQDKPALQRDKA